MARSGVQGIWLPAALVAAAACQGGKLHGGAPDGGGGSSISTGAGGAAGMSCADVTQPLTRTGLDALVLLDTSVSMNDAPGSGSCDGGCGAGSKWAQTTAGIEAVAARTDGTVSWGLGFFSDLSTAICTFGGSRPTVLPVPATSQAIATAIAARTSANGDLVGGGERLTRGAVIAAQSYFLNAGGANRKVIVLATDGVPSCNSEPLDPNGNDSSNALAAIQTAADQGFSTFVIGIGISDGLADANLNQLARAGGVPRAESPAYYPVVTTSDLVTILNGIIAGAANCSFPVPLAPFGTDPSHADVSLDGALLPRDTTHTNGWDYTDRSSRYLQLYGPPCDALTNDPAAHPVSVTFHCAL